MKHRILASIGIVLLVVVVLIAIFDREADADADDLYACWWVEEELLMSGNFHPAALEGVGKEIAEDCDVTPTPEPTPTPIPTPTPVPVPLPDYMCKVWSWHWMERLYTYRPCVPIGTLE